MSGRLSAGYLTHRPDYHAQVSIAVLADPGIIAPAMLGIQITHMQTPLLRTNGLHTRRHKVLVGDRNRRQCVLHSVKLPAVVDLADEVRLQETDDPSCVEHLSEPTNSVA